MKKILISFIALLAVIMCSAQIQVASTGNVGIGDTLSSDKKVFINTIGEYEAGLYSYIKSSVQWGPAILAHADFQTDRQIAIRGYAGNSSPYGSGRAYGVLGSAGNRTSGYNYGVYGELTGTNNGAGIFGTTKISASSINGRYAGYFDGNVQVTENLIAREFNTLSDARYKSNIQQINSNALIKISALNPVQYTMMTSNDIALVNTPKSDTLPSVIVTTSEEDLTEANKIHYGLLAQEVKELYPELVHEDDAGVMSINYIELIPLLIQAVQDLSDQVSSLSYSSSKESIRQSAPQQLGYNTDIKSTTTSLSQNLPNPFTEVTEISYIVPTNAQQATIYIYSMSGVQLMKYDLSTLGESSIIIGANELYAGTFLYSLVVDGKIIDTKQMIITE